MSSRRIRLHFHNHKHKAKPLPPPVEEQTKVEEDKKVSEEKASEAAKGTAEATAANGDVQAKGKAADTPVSIMPQADFHEENDLNNKLTEDSDDIPEEQQKEKPVSLLAELAAEIEAEKKAAAEKEAAKKEPPKEETGSSWYKPWTWFGGNSEDTPKEENKPTEEVKADTANPPKASFGHVTERASENWDRAQKNLEEEGATPFVLDAIATGGEAITDTVREAQNFVGDLVPDNSVTRGAGHVLRILPEAAGLITSVTNTESGSTTKAGKRFLKELTFGFYGDDKETAPGKTDNKPAAENTAATDETLSEEAPSVKEEAAEIPENETPVSQSENNYPRPILSISAPKKPGTHFSMSVDIGDIKIDTDKFETKDVAIPDEVKELLEEDETPAETTEVLSSQPASEEIQGKTEDTVKQKPESDIPAQETIPQADIKEVSPDEIREDIPPVKQEDLENLLADLENEDLMSSITADKEKPVKEEPAAAPSQTLNLSDEDVTIINGEDKNDAAPAPIAIPDEVKEVINDNIVNNAPPTPIEIPAEVKELLNDKGANDAPPTPIEIPDEVKEVVKDDSTDAPQEVKSAATEEPATEEKPTEEPVTEGVQVQGTTLILDGVRVPNFGEKIDANDPKMRELVEKYCPGIHPDNMDSSRYEITSELIKISKSKMNDEQKNEYKAAQEEILQRNKAEWDLSRTFPNDGAENRPSLEEIEQYAKIKGVSSGLVANLVDRRTGYIGLIRETLQKQNTESATKDIAASEEPTVTLPAVEEPPVIDEKTVVVPEIKEPPVIDEPTVVVPEIKEPPVIDEPTVVVPDMKEPPVIDEPTVVVPEIKEPPVIDEKTVVVPEIKEPPVIDEPTVVVPEMKEPPVIDEPTVVVPEIKEPPVIDEPTVVIPEIKEPPVIDEPTVVVPEMKEPASIEEKPAEEPAAEGVQVQGTTLILDGVKLPQNGEIVDFDNPQMRALIKKYTPYNDESIDGMKKYAKDMSFVISTALTAKAKNMLDKKQEEEYNAAVEVKERELYEKEQARLAEERQIEDQKRQAKEAEEEARIAQEKQKIDAANLKRAQRAKALGMTPAEYDMAEINGELPDEEQPQSSNLSDESVPTINNDEAKDTEPTSTKTPADVKEVANVNTPAVTPKEAPTAPVAEQAAPEETPAVAEPVVVAPKTQKPATVEPAVEKPAAEADTPEIIKETPVQDAPAITEEKTPEPPKPVQAKKVTVKDAPPMETKDLLSNLDRIYTFEIKDDAGKMQQVSLSKEDILAFLYKIQSRGYRGKTFDIEDLKNAFWFHTRDKEALARMYKNSYRPLTVNSPDYNTAKLQQSWRQNLVTPEMEKLYPSGTKFDKLHRIPFGRPNSYNFASQMQRNGVTREELQAFMWRYYTTQQGFCAYYDNELGLNEALDSGKPEVIEMINKAIDSRKGNLLEPFEKTLENYRKYKGKT